MAAMIRRHAGQCASWGLLCLLAMPAQADDSAAAIAAGGLVARRETHIVMAKEVLQISPTKIVVDYDFRNDTDQDVTTEVAFPIAPYKNEFPDGDLAEQSFTSFRLWVDGKPVQYKTEAKATLNGKDVTEVLLANHIDIATLGHFDDRDTPITRDWGKLPRSSQERLIKAGLFENQGDSDGYATTALWTAHVQYHWSQVFPAHTVIHVRHEYKPAGGFTQVSLEDVVELLQTMTTARQAHGDQSKLLQSFCPDQPFLRSLGRQMDQDRDPKQSYGGTLYPFWIDFILTSANTWKQPIEDFTLIVDRGQPLDGYGKPMKDTRFLVSFCSPQDAPTEKLDADHFQVHLTNFIPASELHIGFFRVAKEKAAGGAAKK